MNESREGVARLACFELRAKSRELLLPTWQGMANPLVRWQNVCAGFYSNIRTTGTSHR
jgi:hypothetical protein